LCADLLGAVFLVAIVIRLSSASSNCTLNHGVQSSFEMNNPPECLTLLQNRVFLEHRAAPIVLHFGF